MSKAKLTDIFGTELKHIGRSRYGTDAGKGLASLGSFVPSRKPYLYMSNEAQIRMKMTDGRIQVDARVTDIRLYQDDHTTPDQEKVEKAGEQIRVSEHVILSIGFTRAFAGSPDLEPIHWLQVNNIHCEENPTWQLG